MPAPRYTVDNCKPSYQLNWTLALFWKVEPPFDHSWLESLRPLTEKDGVRILEQRTRSNRTSQFLLSATPSQSPSQIIRSVKGRLQHLVRRQHPKAFHRNYSIKSVGSAKLDVVQQYLDSQLQRHQVADPRIQQRLAAHQIDQAQVDLGAVRRSSYGEFLYNLHIVLVHDERWRDVEEGRLARTRDVILKAAAKKGHLLSKARILADHIHMTLGCDVVESPGDVVVGYLNNLAYVYDMAAVFQYGFYAGTFGEYDLGAIRRGLADCDSIIAPPG